MLGKLVPLLFLFLSSSSSKQPVIIDTDVGSFLDDSFAIAYAVLSPDLDVKLIVTTSDDTTARAKVTAKLLRLLERDDIPIGIGIKNENVTQHFLFDWAGNESLSDYVGGVYENGVEKMADILANSEEMVDIIAIGPMTNFPTLVQKYPKSVAKGRVRAMSGSINVGYNGSKVQVAEYNVHVCPWCMEVLLKAGWNVTMTPLDTCGTISLSGDNIKEILEFGSKPIAAALSSTLVYFCITNRFPGDVCDLPIDTPILYDVVATLLALPGVAKQYLDYSTMDLSVNGTGFTVVNPGSGIPTSVALNWKKDGEKQFANMLAKLFSHN